MAVTVPIPTDPISWHNLPTSVNGTALSWHSYAAPVTGDAVFSADYMGGQLHTGPDNQFYLLHHAGDIQPSDIATAKINAATFFGAPEVPVTPSTYTGAGADSAAQNATNYSTGVPVGEQTFTPQGGATAPLSIPTVDPATWVPPPIPGFQNSGAARSSAPGVTTSSGTGLAQQLTAPVIRAGPDASSALTDSTASATNSDPNAGLATSLLGGLGGPSGLASVVAGAGSPGYISPDMSAGVGSTAGLQAIQPIAGATAGTSNPATTIVALAAAGALAVWVYMRHKHHAGAAAHARAPFDSVQS